MAKYITKRLFDAKRGLDLKSSEILRGENYLTYANNIVWDDQANLAKRPGSHLRVYGIPAHSGMVRFDTTDYKGISKSELIFVGEDKPVRLVKKNLTLTNNTGSSIIVSVLYNPSATQYVMTIVGGAIAAINLGLGTGGDLDIAGLILALPLNVVGTSVGGITTVKAAFLETKMVTILNGQSADFEYYSYELIQWGGYLSSPTITAASLRTNKQTASVSGSTYWYSDWITDGSFLWKYDGHVWYQAGLDPGSLASAGATLANGAAYTDCKGTQTLSQAAAWSVSTTDIWVRYAYRDKAGAYHYGDFNTVEVLIAGSSGAANGGQYFSKPSSFGILSTRNCRAIRADGAQAAVQTINVDNPHKLLAGDVAYFWNITAGLFVEREILSITASSITIAPDTITDGDVYGDVSVFDNAMISNNFRAQFYERTSGSTAPANEAIYSGKLIADVPVSATISSVASIVYPLKYTDINETYNFEGATSYQPPTGYYITTTSNGSALLVAGNLESNNTVYCSSVSDPEAFYLGRNAFTVDSAISGLGSSGAVNIVGTRVNSYAVTGDIPNLNFRVEKITENLGIDSASSIVEIDEGAIHFNTHRGPYALLGGRQLQPVGAWPQDKRLSVIEPYFTNIYSTVSYAPQFHYASSNVIKERKWIINSIPWYYGTSYSASNSMTFMFDYGVGGWTTWSGVDASCGAAYWDDKVWCAGQGDAGTINLVSMTENNGDYNFSDHGTPIAATIRMHWENGGDINLYKKFLWLTIHTPIGNGNPYNVNVATYANYEILKNNAFSIPVATHSLFAKYTTPPAYTIEAKLKTGKMASMMLEINNTTVNEGLWYGGSEIDIAGDFQTPSRPGRSDS